jgi:multiple antibiotic resistance protein
VLERWFTALIALLGILNPLGLLPLLADVTSGLDRKARGRLFNLTTFAGFATLFVLTLAGRWVMDNVFRIQMAEFKIAGGILLTVIGIKNIAFPEPAVKAREPSDAMELGVVPLAVPLLVGPGSIVTGILILHRDGPLVALTTIVAAFIATRLIFAASPVVHRVLGHLGALVLSRVLQIFIAAIGVSFLTSGIRELFHL